MLALTATPDQTKIIAGGSFLKVNGSNGYGLVALDATTGVRKTWLINQVVRDYGETAAILSLTADTDTVYDCSNIGGFPDPEPRRYHAALAVTKAASGTVAKNGAGGAQYGNFEGQPATALYNWFPDLTTGTYTGLNQAAWSVIGTTNYLVMGGEFTQVNGEPQQGLVRLALPASAPPRAARRPTLRRRDPAAAPVPAETIPAAAGAG